MQELNIPEMPEEGCADIWFSDTVRILVQRCEIFGDTSRLSVPHVFGLAASMVGIDLDEVSTPVLFIAASWVRDAATRSRRWSCDWDEE